MGWLKNIFNLFKSDYTLIYTAIGDEDCMKIVGKLNDDRIPYKTKSGGIYADIKRRDSSFGAKLSQYDIYVKKDFEYKARMAIEKD